MSSEAMPLADLFLRTAIRLPNSVALAFPSEEFTFAQILDESQLVARGLVSVGVAQGDTVGILAPNSIEFVAGLIGVALIGAIAVPMHVRSTPRELEHLLQHGELKVVLTTDRIRGHADFQRLLCEAIPGLSTADPNSTLDLERVPHLRRVVMLRGRGGDGCMSRAAFEAAGQVVDLDVVDELRSRVRIRDAALLLYTSGTTAQPKGCVISHEAITRGPIGRVNAAFPFDESAGPVVMWCPAPIFHIAALQGFLYTAGVGGTFVTDVHLDADRALEIIKKWRANSLWAMFMPPFRTLMSAHDFRPEELGFVRSLMTVGPAEELHNLQRLFPQALLVNGAGMSETAGWFCMSPRNDSPRMRATSAGKPIAGAQLRILDPETGLDANPNVRGELLVKTYTMLTEYFHDAERTRDAIDADGWLHTGDLFSRLPSGHFVYEGRLKDMLKVGGENVPAIEVESFLCGHPDILTAEVVGLPDARLDEVPVAFVELVAGSAATEREIVDYCRGHLSSFKIPRAVHFVEQGSWPMSATKVNKVELKREALLRAGASASLQAL